MADQFVGLMINMSSTGFGFVGIVGAAGFSSSSLQGSVFVQACSLLGVKQTVTDS